MKFTDTTCKKEQVDLVRVNSNYFYKQLIFRNFANVTYK